MEAAERMEKQATELLRQLIQIESISWEEDQLAEFVADRLMKSGIEVSRDRHGNLYGEYHFGAPAGQRSGIHASAETEGGETEWSAEPDGREGPVILFNTHLDNVPVGEGWERAPFAAEEKDGVVFGRGACDPKGAMAAMIVAVETIIKEAENNKNQDCGAKGTILFMGAVTEEVSPPSSKGTRKAVVDGLVKADMAICGEPTDNLPCIGEFGKMEYELITHGKPAHAGAPEKGVNSILHMARLVLALDEKAERRWSDLLGRRGTLNVGMISGGVQINIVPETTKAMVERRLVPGQSAGESLAELRRICDEVKEQVPGLDYELRVTGEGNAAVISGDEPVARLMEDSVEAITGERPGPKGFTAHADADWLITYGGIPTVIYGPGSLSHAHTSHEQVKCADVAEAALVLAEFLRRAFHMRTDSRETAGTGAL